MTPQPRPPHINLEEHLRNYQERAVMPRPRRIERGFMDTITVKRDDVIATLKENREKHIATYTEADANYRQTCVDALRTRADDIADGGKITLYFELPEPEDHTEDYDEAIAALEWDQREIVELSRQEFRQYVLDKWRWEQSFLANTMSYSGSAR